MSSSFSFGGIASGLPADIVDQLIAVERQPISRMEARKSKLNVEKGAWSQVTTKLSGVRTSLDALRKPGAFDAFVTGTSSDPKIVGVSAAAGAPAQSLTFTVTKLATREQRSSQDTFTSRDASLGGRTLSLAIAGQTHEVTPANGTLQGLVDEINGRSLGVTASTIQVASGQHQLVLRSTQTGVDNAFSIDGASSGWTGFTQLDAAGDAELTVGSTNPITIMRSSNTITDLMDGVTLNLKKVSAEPVTVTSERNTDGAVAAVKKLVDDVNATLGTIKSLTSYNGDSGVGGSLNGDATARQLADQLRSALSQPIAALTERFPSANSIGIQVTREGTFRLDETVLRDALKEDFRGVASVFTGTVTSSSALTSATRGTAVAGEHQLTLATLARSATVTGATVSPRSDNPATYEIRTPSGATVTVVIPKRSTPTEALSILNSAISAAEVQAELTASLDGDALVLTSSGVGSATTFSITEVDADPDPARQNEWGLVGTYAGSDAQVTDADGTVHTGAGTSVKIASGPSAGLTITSGEAAGTPFTISVTDGIGSRLDAVLETFEGSDGAIARAENAIVGRTKLLDDRIESFESRLEIREASLRRQFAALERMMGDMQSRGNWLAGQLGALTGNQQRN